MATLPYTKTGSSKAKGTKTAMPSLEQRYYTTLSWPTPLRRDPYALIHPHSPHIRRASEPPNEPQALSLALGSASPCVAAIFR